MRTAMTVLGKVPVKDLGFTLSHEHLVMGDKTDSVWHVDPSEIPGMHTISADDPVALDNLGALRRAPSIIKDNTFLPGLETMTNEVNYYKNAGGGSIVEVSCIGLRGDANILRQLSEATGVHIIASTGYYLEGSWPDYAHEATVDELRKIMVSEYENGIEDTSVRPGIIAEMGTSKITPGEEKMLRAAARASQETGLAVCTHANAEDRNGVQIVDILISEGMSPERIILGHLGSNIFEQRVAVLERFPERALAYLDYAKSVLDLGVTGAFDVFGKEYYVDNRGWKLASDHQRIAAILKLIDSGYASQLVLSHDIARKFGLHAYGGWGYDHIHAHIIPRLQDQGVSDYDIREMTTNTPARLLSIAS